MKVKFVIREAHCDPARGAPFADAIRVRAEKADVTNENVDPSNNSYKVHEIRQAQIQFEVLVPLGSSENTPYIKGQEFYIEFSPAFS